MSKSDETPSPRAFTSSLELLPYNKEHPMTTPQTADVASPARSAGLMSDTDQPPHLRFRSSVPLLPTPGTVSKRHPPYVPLELRFYLVALGAVLLGLIGVALEVAQAVSNNNNGFYVPRKNVFSFASAQFLASFFPSLLALPLAIMIHAFDSAIRLWNPYLILSRGHATADETLMLNYVSDSWPVIGYHALKFKHQFILVSGITALSAMLLQPLAGSVFSIRQLPQSSPTTVQSIRTIGLSSDISDLTSFVSSAGFAEAAVFNDIGEPSFVFGGWATAEFKFATDVYLNGTMGVNTTGIRTSVNCAIPNQITLTQPNANVSTVSATSIDGCSLQVNFNPTSAPQQYGVTNVPNCGAGNTTDVAFQPVFFWFWEQNPSQAAGVFCQPAIQLFDVTAFAFLNNNSLYNVTILDKYPAANNVSGPPLNGVPYNGLIFDSSPDINVQSRADTIRTGIPHAIVRQAQQAPGGLQSTFQDPNAFLNYTSQIYTLHLSLATKTNYFIEQNKTVSAILTELVPRLFVQPAPAHLLASLCMVLSIMVFFTHLIHFRQRKDIEIPHPPGSIISSVALTSHSGFGDLLAPYDNQAAFSRALAPLRFCLDRRTGAIIVDESAVAYAGDLPTHAARDETMMTLIGKSQQHQREDSLGPETRTAI